MQIFSATQSAAQRLLPGAARAAQSARGTNPNPLAATATKASQPAGRTSTFSVIGTSTPTPTAAPTASPTNDVSGPGKPQQGQFGDVNGDGIFDSSDATALLRYLFQGGDAPVNMDNADVDGDGQVNVADVVTMMNITRGQGPYTTPSSSGNNENANAVPALNVKA